MRLRAILLLPLAACDLVFGTSSGAQVDAPASGDDAPPGALHPQLALPAQVDTIAAGDPVTQVRLTVPGAPASTVYYRLSATDGTFSTNTTEITGAMTDGAATAAWAPPFAPAKVTFTAAVSLDRDLAGPATTQGGLVVRQLLGHPTPGGTPQLLAAGQILALSFFAPGSAENMQVVALGAYVPSGVNIRLALYEEMMSTRVLRGATSTAPVTAAATVAPLTPPVQLTANGHYWIAILGDSQLTVSSADSTATEIVGRDTFASFNTPPPELTSTNDGGAVPPAMFAAIELK